MSVIVASIDAGRSIDRCLDHLCQACEGLDAELIVVDASRDDTSSTVATRSGTVRLIRRPVGTLAPHLWAEGYRQTSGRIVAFTTGHCVVVPGWARALAGALDAGASGAGGPLRPAPGTGPVDWAVFYLRYSGFLQDGMKAGRVRGDIAGDNAAYRREALEPYAHSFDDGFWETRVHKLLRADGGWLMGVPEAIVEFGPSFPFTTAIRHRFAHGAQFGASRVWDGARARWQIVLAAPLVPGLFLWRVLRRVRRSALDCGRLLASLPWFLLLASAWSAGEAWGAWRAARRPRPSRSAGLTV